ncbi:hypothetical protein [Candidatus Nitrospira bockiana]
MSLVLYPRVASSGKLRVWVGAFNRTTAPADLQWEIAGIPSPAVVAVRPLSSVRPDGPGGMVGRGEPRAFSGVYEFDGLQPGTVYDMALRTEDETAHLTTRTLPAEVPRRFGETFNVLLISCFHQAEDRGGLAGTVVSQLKAASKPHLTLLLGDQVYLDPRR